MVVCVTDWSFEKEGALSQELESRRWMPAWIYTENAGWMLFCIGAGLLVPGGCLGFHGSDVSLIILGTLAVIICFVGAIWSVTHCRSEPKNSDTPKP